MKNIEKFLLKIFISYNFKNLCILHGQVFLMNIYDFEKEIDHRGYSDPAHITKTRPCNKKRFFEL